MQRPCLLWIEAQQKCISIIVQRFFWNEQVLENLGFVQMFLHGNGHLASLQIAQISIGICKLWTVVEGNFLQVHLSIHTDPAIKQSSLGLAGLALLLDLGICLGLDYLWAHHVITAYTGHQVTGAAASRQLQFGGHKWHVSWCHLHPSWNAFLCSTCNSDNKLSFIQAWWAVVIATSITVNVNVYKISHELRRNQHWMC